MSARTAAASAAPALPSAAWGDDEASTGLTANQRRLLYLLSLYSRAARTNVENEEWVRRLALLVLVYECIVARVLDYDYAPVSMLVHGQRVYFNMSQEGASDIDFLREEGLVNGLKLASNDYSAVTCYQVAIKGAELLKRVPRADKDAINTVCLPPGSMDPVRVLWRLGRFLLVGASGFEKASTVLDVEDVSYVGSAYIPQCLRFGGRPTLSNAHRAAECAKAASTVRDVLDEVITLNSVSVIVAEYIPFGANNLAQVNACLGAGERVPGGLFTSVVDDDATGTKFSVEPGLTSVSILDHSNTRHVNFEADIYLPEQDGVVQIETLGISMNADGTTYYGMQVEAVMDRIKDNVSLDQLSRLLVDVSIDSSSIMDSLLSAYQRKLLAAMFAGNATSRDKVYVIIANEISPHLTAEEYLDKGDYENELKQILGETRAAFDISENDTLIFGSHGLIIAGPSARVHEALLCSYIQFNAMELFVRSFFARMFLVNDSMRSLRQLVNTFETEPLAVNKISARLQSLSDDVRLLGEVLGYIVEALEACELPQQPTDPPGKALFARLQLADYAAQLSMRVIDLKKLFDGVRQELAHLRHLAHTVFDMRMYAAEESSLSVLRRVAAHQETQERSASTLNMIMVLLAGVLAFEVLDRLTGNWTVMDSDWMRDFATPVIRRYPLVWFGVNLLFWAVLAGVCVRLLYLFFFAAQGTTSVTVRVMQPIVLERFYTFLQSKITNVEERIYDSKNTIIRVSWEESNVRIHKVFGGSTPRITVEYDKSTAFMYSISIQYNRRLAKRNVALGAMQLREVLGADLCEAGIFVDKAFAFSEEATKEAAAATASSSTKRRSHKVRVAAASAPKKEPARIAPSPKKK